MRSLAKLSALVVASIVVLVAVMARPDEKIPRMKFNDVKEIAPGVFFRYSSISANDPKIPFGGSNHAWIVFKDYVVVIDANFPKEAADVIADIKKTTEEADQVRPRHAPPRRPRLRQLPSGRRKGRRSSLEASNRPAAQGQRAEAVGGRAPRTART